MKYPNPDFWRGRRVLLTGHTGFKGSWLALMLSELGAEVIGAALPPEPGPSLHAITAPASRLVHHVMDLREPAPIAALVRETRPFVVLHLAAQALVPRGFTDPVGTFAANLTCTINVLEAIRGAPGIAAALMVTTDKVYRNPGDGRQFCEDDPLGGDDPYSASKAAAELAVASWRASFAADLPPLATARAGNVMGGGDFAPTRLVPDLVRARTGTAKLVLRHPRATRPWQHVLDVLTGYLLQVEHLAAHPGAPPALNFGPAEIDRSSVLDIIAGFEAAFEIALPWQQAENSPFEAPLLTLDSTLAKKTLGWAPRLDRDGCIAATASWYAAWARGEKMRARCVSDVKEALG